MQIQGVDVILGNGLARSRIWKEDPPLVYVGSVLQVPKEPEGCAKESPKVSSPCAVTRTRSKALSVQSELSEQGQSSQAGVSEGKELYTPSRTNMIEHDMEVGDTLPVRQWAYRMPVEKRQCMEKEYLLQHGLAEPSCSYIMGYWLMQSPV